MAELFTSTVTYSGKGQTSSPVGSGAIDPSVMSFSMGGARLVALYSAYQQVEALKANLTIAKNYYNENKKDFDFWQSTYQAKMASALFEGMGRGFYRLGGFVSDQGALDYRASIGRGQATPQIQTDKAWFLTRRKTSKYNIGIGRRLDYKYAVARLNAEFEGWNLGFRYEDTRKMKYDEERHAHQAEILNLGIGATNAARAGLSTSVATLSEAKSQRASQMASLSNGLSTFAGFMDSRRGMQQSQQAQQRTSRMANDYSVIGGVQNLGSQYGPQAQQSQVDFTRLGE